MSKNNYNSVYLMSKNKLIIDDRTK